MMPLAVKTLGRLVPLHQTFSIGGPPAVAAGPVPGVGLEACTLPVGPSGAAQAAAKDLEPAARQKNYQWSRMRHRSSGSEPESSYKTDKINEI